MNNDFDEAVRQALQNPEAMGEMSNADAVGTAGSESCGDMLKMWVKFREEDGRRVVDRATFQAFGCQTAIAVASAAVRMIQGKTPEEALALTGEDFAAPLGPLPPMKIHCAQLVEQALQGALGSSKKSTTPYTASSALANSLSPQPSQKIRFL